MAWSVAVKGEVGLIAFLSFLPLPLAGEGGARSAGRGFGF
jgi:hypothetical protein